MVNVVRCHTYTIVEHCFSLFKTPTRVCLDYGYRLLAFVLQVRIKQFWLIKSVIFLQLSRVFGKLLERGWRPHRTIVLCSWDAEEYGLVCTIPPLPKLAMFIGCVVCTSIFL